MVGTDTWPCRAGRGKLVSLVTLGRVKPQAKGQRPKAKGQRPKAIGHRPELKTVPFLCPMPLSPYPCPCPCSSSSRSIPMPSELHIVSSASGCASCYLLDVLVGIYWMCQLISTGCVYGRQGFYTLVHLNTPVHSITYSPVHTKNTNILTSLHIGLSNVPYTVTYHTVTIQLSTVQLPITNQPTQTVTQTCCYSLSITLTHMSIHTYTHRISLTQLTYGV